MLARTSSCTACRQVIRACGHARHARAYPPASMRQPPKVHVMQPLQPTSSIIRPFATRTTKKKREKERQRQLRYNERQERRQQEARLKNLHPAAKMKRILSALDYWFSAGNLAQDTFFTNELRDYQGYVRLTTLASFPKIARLDDTNLEQLIYATCASEAAEKRYRIIFNQELVEAVALNKKRHERIRIQQEVQEEQLRKKEQAEHKQWRNQRIQELEQLMEEFQKEHLVPKYKARKWGLHAYDVQEYLYESLKADWPKLYQQANTSNTIHRLLDYMKIRRHVLEYDYQDTIDGLKDTLTAMHATDATPFSEELQQVFQILQDDDDDGTSLDDCWGEYGDMEYQLVDEHEEYANLVSELHHLEHEIESEWEDENWNRRMDRDMQDTLRDYDRRDKTTTPISMDELEALGISDRDDPNRTEDWALPDPIVDDGSDLIQYALIRHKRVTLEYLDRQLSHASDDDDDDDEYAGMDWWDEDYQLLEQQRQAREEEAQAKKKKKKEQNQQTSLKKYSSLRTVKVIQNARALDHFCRQLSESLETHAIVNSSANGIPASKAIGFDVEYCSLEEDIRMTLPAMLQLASPLPHGPVGLIWLDKFPNHGRDMLAGQDDEYQSLFQILKDPNIDKVGVGATSDAKHLLHWWGIPDTTFMDFYIRGMAHLEMEVAGGGADHGGKSSLQELCASVLKRDLPKLKERDAKQKKQKRKQGQRAPTSHWRRKDLTKEMKAYAADDASASIDIWLHLQKEASTTKEDEGGKGDDTTTEKEARTAV